MRTYDVAIIGNGIIATSIAAELDPSARIALIGKGTSTDRGATGAAGAMLNSFAESVPEGVSETANATSNTAENSATKDRTRIARQATKMWQQHTESLEIADHVVKGTYVILNSRSGGVDERNYNATLAALQQHGEPFEIAEPTDVPNIEPTPDNRPLRALYIPGENAINPQVVMSALRKRIETSRASTASTQPVDYIDAHAINFTFGAANATASASAATTAHAQDNTVTTVRLDNGETIAAKAFVIANGAFAQPLLAQLSERANANIPPVLAGCGIAFRTKRPHATSATNPTSATSANAQSTTVRTPVRSGGCGLHMVTTGDDVYIGATNEVSPTPKRNATIGATQNLLNTVINQLHTGFANAHIEQWHVGNRPISLDTHPLIGKGPQENVWIATGTYREGFHNSPLIAQFIARAIESASDSKSASATNTAHADLFAQFTPARKLIGTQTREDAIESAVTHFVSGSYEHGISLPAFLNSDDLREMYDHQIRKLYNELETDYPLSPEFIDMCFTEGAKTTDWLRTALS